MEISRLGINIQDATLYIEYCSEKDELPDVKKVELTEELLSPNNVDKLIEYLKKNKSNLFDDNFDFLKPKFVKLLSSISEYKTEKILKSGTNKEIDTEKSKMDTTFETNKIRPSDENFVYDKRVDFETNKIRPSNEELPNDWDEDNDEDNEILDEDIAILDEDIEEDIDEDIDDDENVDKQFLQNMCADFTENDINNENINETNITK
eukprot:304434_1